MASRRAFASILLFSVPLLVGIAAACGSSDDSSFPIGGDDAGFESSIGPGFGEGGFGGEGGVAHVDAVSIAYVPASQTLTVDGVHPASQNYQLVATLKAGGTAVVLPDSVQFDRPDIASAKIDSTTTLTTPGTYAGTGTLHGVYGVLSATATLSVVVNQKNTNGVSSTIVAALDAASAADTSVTSLLYPYDKTVFALGLTSPLVMWNAPTPGDTYRFELSQANYTYDVYATVGATGQFRIDQAIWDTITASNKSAASPLTLKVSRYDAASAKAYVSATESFSVAPESLRGAIYYWTASKDSGGNLNGHITRFRPGTGATPVVLNNGKCMGCHAVNANGTVLVGDIDDGHESNAALPRTDPSLGPYGNWSGTRPWASFDVSDSTSDAGATLTLETNKFGADIALTPDGTYVVFGGPTQVATGGSSISNPLPGSKNISLGYVADGGVIATSGLDDINLAAGRGIQMPAFSPDGTKLAVIVSKQSADNVIPDSTGTSIAFLTFDETIPKFGATLTTLVDGTDTVFPSTHRGLAYPSFTPDSTAVAFHSGTHATGCNSSCDNAEVDDGSLYVQPIAKGGVASPVRMTIATDPPNASEAGLSVEPTFNPQARGGYSWVVFTSMRTWGNQPFPAGTAAGHVNGKRRLWVAAVDPTIGTVDPSHPAIFLEGQEDTPNMRAFWANATCTPTAPAGSPPNACGAGYECCSGFCVDNACVDVSKVACTGTGEACTTSAQCCNSSAVSCVSNVCTPHPPR
ncbi:MAG: hypothetical protein ABI461_23070 [Polyangiaceae bacterium]